jgi:hypothetical protein
LRQRSDKDQANPIGHPIITSSVLIGSAAIEVSNSDFPIIDRNRPHPPTGVHLARGAGWRESFLI